MIRVLALLLLTLPGCSATQALVTCDNAAKARAALSAAYQALDRACPMNPEAQ